MAVYYADKESCLHRFSKWGWEVRFDFSLKSAIKKETFTFSQLLAACSMITKELSTQGLQFFQGVLHFSVLRLRAIEHITTGKPLSRQMPEPGRLGHAEPALGSWDSSQATQKRTSQVNSYSSYFSAYSSSDSKEAHKSKCSSEAHGSVWEVRQGEGRGQKEWPHRRAGIRVSSKAVQDGVGKGLEHKFPALQQPRDNVQGGRGTAGSSRGEQCTKQRRVPVAGLEEFWVSSHVQNIWLVIFN